MKIYFNSIKMCLKRAVLSKRFIGAVLMTFLFITLDMLPDFLANIHVVDGEKYYSGNIVNMLELNGTTLFLGFSFITAVISYSGALCDDMHNNFVIPFIKRSTMKGYAVGTVTACGVSTFLAVFCAYMASICIFSIFVPLQNVNGYGGMSSLMKDGHVILYILARVILYSLRGSFFALMALMISTVVKSKYVIFAVPFILYYFMMRFGYSILNVPGELNILGVYFNFIFTQEHELLSLMYSFAYTVVTAILTGTAISFKIRRCL